MIEDVEQRWDYAKNKWVNSLRKTFAYDDDTGEISEETVYRWNRADDQWAVESRFLYTDIKPEETEA